jgi:cytochrome c oxidase assembly protein subunit 15
MMSLSTLRRFAYAALCVAFAHLIFGAIVRISGSGMGCGDHWPLCYGRLFPPFDRPDLVVEWTHRLLASILVLSVAAFAVMAWRARRMAGVGGRGGVLRAALLAVIVVVAAALLGAVTVKLGNTPYATVAHWLVAMTLFATLGAAAIRAGALGGAGAIGEHASPRVARAAYAAALLAFLTVALGGLTAKLPSAAIACRSFPLCGPDPAAGATAVHVQLTHRILAFLLLLHLIGVVSGLSRRREESRTVARAAMLALGLVIVQLTVAASMVLLTLPPFLRSLHEAVGVSVWLATFSYAYLARIAAGRPAPTSSHSLGDLPARLAAAGDPIVMPGSR